MASNLHSSKHNVGRRRGITLSRRLVTPSRAPRHSYKPTCWRCVKKILTNRPHCVGAYSKTCAKMHSKGNVEKNVKSASRARRAFSPFKPIRFSRVHTFPANPTRFGFKV